MNIETRKLSIINWISTIQEEEILAEVEKLQQGKRDWWDNLTSEDEKAINEGLNQLDNGEFLTRSQVRKNIIKKFNL